MNQLSKSLRIATDHFYPLSFHSGGMNVDLFESWNEGKY